MLVQSFLYLYQPKACKKKAPSVPDAYKLAVDNLSGFFGSKIQFKRKPTGAGAIVVNFKNDEDLNRILDLIEDKN